MMRVSFKLAPASHVLLSLQHVVHHLSILGSVLTKKLDRIIHFFPSDIQSSDFGKYQTSAYAEYLSIPTTNCYDIWY